MRPRNKSNASSTSSSKKPQQPSKFGIQHFFERHSQNASQNPKTLSDRLPKEHDPIDVDDDYDAALASRNPKNRPGSKENAMAIVSQDTPPKTLEKSDGLGVESPEISKSVSLKRFKFSPGMLIQQSQDDGGDEITWKISPVNERLQSVSKRSPGMMRMMAESSRKNSTTILQCSETKSSPAEAGKVEKWISSPTVKTSKKLLVSRSRVGLKRVNPEHDTDLNQSSTDVMDSIAEKEPSPFRTPPSSFSHDKLANDISNNGFVDLHGQKQHKKALLELLDQVGDVISVEDPVSDKAEESPCHHKDNTIDEQHIKDNLALEVEGTNFLESPKPLSNSYFLVLEVTEKHGPVDASGAQHPLKVLRLLNEQSGVERAVYLSKEWVYSVICPGYCVNVIGEFDDQGICQVNHEQNFVIVHPDLLMSGTRVTGSFSCPRRAVLDERLRSDENSAAALIGTLLHQVFQAGLTKERPTISYLEEYAHTVLHKNIESLYACKVNERDIYRTLIEAVPKLLNWVNLFKNLKGSGNPIVDFGSNIGPKEVKISEVSDIEEMAWAPKYGLKGMIDASVRVEVGSNKYESSGMVMPLEFKSGKPPNGQSSMEHSAQVMLYTLLMSERYQISIDSGLLYYLQSDQTQVAYNTTMISAP